MAKWGERAKHEVRNKLAVASPAPKGDALGRQYPEIAVKPHKVRRRR